MTDLQARAVEYDSEIDTVSGVTELLAEVRVNNRSALIDWRHANTLRLEVERLAAALAASRADAEQLRDHVRELQEQDERNLAEIVALGDEVSQLRATVEQLRKLAARGPRLHADLFHEFDPYAQNASVFCKRCGNSEGNVYHDLDLRSVAEPLGSTPEQEQAKCRRE